MDIASSKRQRLMTCELDSNNVHNKKHINTIYHRVLCQQDYLQSICFFLTTIDVISLFSPLSKYHNDFLKDQRQLSLYQQLLYYDFGHICQLYQIKYKPSSKQNVYQFVTKFYSDWKYMEICD